MNPEAFKIISLEGRVAIVSGAASGIGLETCRRLAEFGCAVALLDIDEENGRRAAAEIAGCGGQALFVRGDVRSDDDCRRAVESTVESFGRVDILFNNAGLAVRKNAVDCSESEWDRAVDVMLKGTFLLSRHVIPHMARAGGGSIVNMGSGWALKGGILNMTRAMAIDHGPQGIRVNCVCPGDVDTPLLRGECAQLGLDQADFMTEAARRPLGRVGTPRDVADAVLFFVSDLSKWVTGAFLVVDGGGIA